MQKWIDQLKPGDPIIIDSGGFPKDVCLTVEQINDYTLETSCNCVFRLDDKRLALATPERIEAIRKEKVRYLMAKQLQNYNWHRLSIKELQAVLAALP